MWRFAWGSASSLLSSIAHFHGYIVAMGIMGDIFLGFSRMASVSTSVTPAWAGGRVVLCCSTATKGQA
jgi:hypothetical protein